MKTLLADDHPLMREGVRQVLSQLEPPVEIIDAHDYPSLFAQTALHADLDLALVPNHRTTSAMRWKPARSATFPRPRPPP